MRKCAALEGLGSSEQSAQEGDEDRTDEGNAATGHELLHALRLSTGVIVAIAFEQVDDAPNAKTGTESNNESLQYIDCGSEESHR